MVLRLQRYDRGQAEGRAGCFLQVGARPPRAGKPAEPADRLCVSPRSYWASWKREKLIPGQTGTSVCPWCLAGAGRGCWAWTGSGGHGRYVGEIPAGRPRLLGSSLRPSGSQLPREDSSLSA